MRKTFLTTISAAAMAAVLFASCGKSESISTFYLSTAPLHSPDGTKTYWDTDGLWWDGGEDININGDLHTVNRPDDSHSQWYTSTDVSGGTAAVNDMYYVVYPYVRFNNYNYRNYGPISLEVGQVPLTCAGTTNRMTLYPCCAVIRIIGGSHVDFSTNEDFDDYGVIDGSIVGSDIYLDLSSNSIISGREIDYDNGLDVFNDNDDAELVIIPMVGNSVTAYLSFDWGGKVTSNPVTLKKGYIYVVDMNE